jgi:hypothetical protein
MFVQTQNENIEVELDKSFPQHFLGHLVVLQPPRRFSMKMLVVFSMFEIFKTKLARKSSSILRSHSCSLQRLFHFFYSLLSTISFFFGFFSLFALSLFIFSTTAVYLHSCVFMLKKKKPVRRICLYLRL